MNQVRERGAHGAPTKEGAQHSQEWPFAANPGTAAAEAATARAVAERSRGATKFALSAVLVSSVAVQAFVLYAVTDPAIRIGLGLLPIVPIMWASSRLGLVDRFTRAMDERRRVRRYVKLRSRVCQMIEEIKRMNWIAVDMERGYRTQEDGVAELDAIQTRLRTLVESLREVAGVDEVEGAW